MNKTQRPTNGEALTNLILTMFRVNNLSLTWGDKLVAPLGLTSARWQILGAIVAAERPQPVAWLARDLGANRQNVQRIVNDLSKDGLVSLEANPHHRRAKLVVLAAKGQKAYDKAIQLYEPQINAIATGLSTEELETTHRVLTKLKAKFEGNEPA